ncbi:MAG: hypothetical protein QMC40_00175 [Vicingaceae bacterium]
MCSSNNANLEIEISNIGLDTIQQNQLKVFYQLNSGQIFTDSNLLAILPDSNNIFKYNISGISHVKEDTFKTWVQLLNDSNNFTDTMSYYLINKPDELEYYEGFENLITLAWQCGSYNNPLNKNQKVVVGDQWVVSDDSICNYGNSGATPNLNSGPDIASNGHGFIYFEPGFNSVIDTAILYSTCLDLTQDSSIALSYYYHMYGAGTGELYIDVNLNGTWLRVDSLIGQQHFSGIDPWSQRRISLNQFSGEINQMRFTAIESSASNSDEGNIAIDNFSIYDPLLTAISKNTAKTNYYRLYPNPTVGEFVLQGLNSNS